MLQLVETSSTAIVTKRFTTFDRIYVLLMEAQVAFFTKGAAAVDVFKRPVSNYRAKFPKGKARVPSVPAPKRTQAKPVKDETPVNKRRGTTPEPVVAQPQSPPPAQPVSNEPLLDLDFTTTSSPPAPAQPVPVVAQQPKPAAKPRDDR